MGDDGQEIADAKGEFEKRIVRRQDDVRQVAYLLAKDKEAFELFRRERDLERVYSLALARKYEQQARESADPIEEVFQAIHSCARLLDNIPYKAIRDPATKQRLLDELKKLDEAITSVRQ